MSRAPRCHVALAACAPGSAASGPPHHHRAAEQRRAFRLRPAVERRAASVPGTSFAAKLVARRSLPCVGGIRRVRSRVRQRTAFFQYLAPLVVQLWRPASIRRNVGLRACASPVRALTLRSTGPAGTCFDLRSSSRGGPVTFNVRAHRAAATRPDRRTDCFAPQCR